MIVFHSLKEEHLQQIVSLMSNQLRKRLQEQEIDFVLTDAASKYLAQAGFDPTYGARPLRRAIQKHIEDRLSEELLKGSIKRGDTLEIDEKDGKLQVQREEKHIPFSNGQFCAPSGRFGRCVFLKKFDIIGIETI